MPPQCENTPKYKSVTKKLIDSNIVLVGDNTHTNTHTHTGILFSHQKEWNLAIYIDVDGARVHYVKQNKSVIERQILYDFTCICNLGNKTWTYGKEKRKGKERDREANHERLLTIENKWLMEGSWLGRG